MDDQLLEWDTLTPPPRKASIGIGPSVVPGTADCIGLYFRAVAATGSLYDIVSDYTVVVRYINSRQNRKIKALERAGLKKQHAFKREDWKLLVVPNLPYKGSTLIQVKSRFHWKNEATIAW